MATENSMTEAPPSAAVVAAANYWAEAIRQPRFDNGEPLASLLGTMLASRQPSASTSQRESFAEILAKALQVDLDRCREYGGVSVGVDYGPDRILADAAKSAGVSTGQFPWKTMMWVKDDYVTVSAGYGAPTVLVWGTDAWLADRPVCTSQKYDEKKYRTVENYGGEPWQCSAPIFHEGDHVYDRALPLCGRCGHPEDFWHSDERTWSPDFHSFEPAS